MHGIAAQVLLGLFESFFSPFALSDIDRHGQRSRHFSFRVPVGNGRKQNIDLLAVFLDEPVADFLTAAGLEKYREDDSLLSITPEVCGR